ncbi:MAG: FMN-binding negative transcriptional regulator [Sphaerotilus sp.]|nr:FMN-binding negative transcriptional regulator [Sphaerotilus sp.]
MYLPAHFAEARTEELHRLLCAHPLGSLVTYGPDGLDADHIPFAFDPDTGPHGTLLAHVARANPLWERCPTGTPVMVIFQGAEGYISPNWYPSKHEAHRQVPTWNYEVVHAHGMLTVRDDVRFLRGLVARLTRHHEQAAGEPQPWKMSDAPTDYIDDLLGRIVGIEITLTSLVGKAKLSQNKEARDRLQAADTLQARGHDALAQRMRAAD